MSYDIKDMARDSKRAMQEYRERAFYKKFYVLGRLRQKGDEKSVQFTSALLTFGTVLTGSFT